jgi:hypothetical protein
MTETITRLTMLMFSRFQMFKKRFIQSGKVVGRFITGARLSTRSLLAVKLDWRQPIAARNRSRKGTWVGFSLRLAFFSEKKRA